MRSFFKEHLVSIVVYGGCILFTVLLILIHNEKIKTKHGTFRKIQRTGKIRLITDNSATCFYFYRGARTGFEYELALKFADYLDVELDVITPGWNNVFSFLETGRGDFAAAGITITEKRAERFDFSISYMTIQQRLVHHKMILGPDSIKDLDGRTLHVRRGTSYHYRLQELKEKGIALNYVLHNNVPTEELLRMVAKREIKFAVADSNIARLNRRYYPDLRIGIPLKHHESLGWAVRKNDTRLLESINNFLVKIKTDGTFKKIYNKYYGNIHIFDYFDVKKFHERIDGRLPKYKDVIVKEAEKHGFDWRIIAAVIYQESRFNPKARSFTNVRGLMQVTSDTAMEMGIDNRRNPYQSIEAGVRYLKKMYDRFDDIEDRYQRLLFAIGSYNVGYGHIRDAQKIAEKKGLNKNSWHALEKVLPLLSKRKYYKHTTYGYARGWEPVQYVERIMTYYDILKKRAKQPDLMRK